MVISNRRDVRPLREHGQGGQPQIGSTLDNHLDSDSVASTRTNDKIGQRPLQRRAIATRDHIVSAAAEHFNTVGYAATNISDILAGTGTSKGALYHHFPSKKALAQYLVQSWSTVLVGTISRITAADEPPVQQVASIQRELATVVAKDRVARAGMLLCLEQAFDEHAKVYTAWTSALTVIVDQAIRTSQLSDTAAQTRLGESLCAGFVGAIHVATRLGEAETISRRVDDLLTFWLGSTRKQLT